MNSARHVGRVGALAVALGIGTAIASGGVAHALPDDPSQPNTSATDPGPTPNDPSHTATHLRHPSKPLRSLIRSIVKPEQDTAAKPDTETTDSTDKDATDSTDKKGGRPTRTVGNEGVSTRKDVTTESSSGSSAVVPGIAQRPHRPLRAVFATGQNNANEANEIAKLPTSNSGATLTAGPSAKFRPLSAVKNISAVKNVNVTPNVNAAPSVSPAAALAPVTTPSPIRRVLSFLTSIGLTPEAFPAGSPLAPFGRLLEFTYAALRRVDNIAFNQAPTGFSTSAPAAPDPKTGVITGTLAIDPDGDVLNYDVTTAPKYGTLDIAQATPGTLTYTYTPDYTMSLTGNEADEAFTVNVRDDTTFHLNPGEATVTVSNIDVLPNNTVVKTIDPGDQPMGIAINKAGNRVYVVTDANKIQVIDADPTSATYNTIIQTAAVANGPEGVTSVVRPDGKEYVYVVSTEQNFATSSSDDIVTVFENVNGTLQARPSIDLSPSDPGTKVLQDVAGSPDGSKVYVTGANDFFVIDTTTNAVIADLPLPNSLNSVATGNTPNGPYAYVSNYKGEVRVIDLATNTEKPFIPLSSSDLFTSDIVLSPDGRYAYVSDEGIYVIDTQTNTVVNVLQGGPDGVTDARGLAISGDGKRLYVNRINFDEVDVIDTATGEKIGTTTVNETVEVVVTPDGTRAYVYSFDPPVFGGTPTVSVIAYEVPAEAI